MKAIILAGGKGTRLGKLTEDIPKPMIPVMGKPLLEYQIELCKRYGLEEVILLVNHLKAPIKEHFRDGRDFGIRISYFEEKEPLGTVGGIKEIENQLSSDFLVLYGDVMMEMDLSRLILFHQSKKSDATLVVHPNDHPYDSDLVELGEDDRISAIYPKPHPSGFQYHNMVNAAAYIFSPNIFTHLKKGVKADFGKDIFPEIVDKLNMYGYNTPEYLKDMGTPGRLEQVEEDLRAGKVQRRSLSKKQKAIFLDRDGVLNYDTDLIHRPEDFNLYPFTADSIKKINKSDYLSVITTNQSVVARNLTTIDGLGEIHKKMETLLGNKGAKLDAIYYCPHHPDGGFPGENPLYKVVCDCRKPKAGMHKKAAEKFNISLKDSYMIGDSERDVMAGKNAGCTTVGVRTGHGLRKSEVVPDYIFENLYEAIDFIMKKPFEKVCERILEAFSKCEKSQFILRIGGQSRSGKSTLATYIQKRFEENGEKVLKISLDNWILPREERQAETDVFHNFQMPRLEKDLQSFFSGNTIEAPGYQVHNTWPLKPVSYSPKGFDLIIVEGIVGLSSDVLKRHSDLSVFKKINPELHKERFSAFYRWKGYKEEDILKLWAERKTNEFDLINGDIHKADLVI